MAAATRRVRYQVAASLDGFIATPDGKPDWIPRDPDIDFGALFAQFDTFLLGRRTFEAMAGQGQSSGMKTVVGEEGQRGVASQGLAQIQTGGDEQAVDRGGLTETEAAK